GWRVLPNPSKGMFRLEGRQAVEVSEVVISDLQGRVISRLVVRGMRVSEWIDLSHMSSGVYVLQVRGADGKWWTEKLLKE
ncbi:MAG: T9SS type A sorting domain-containing protein, partial [Cytophagales bacterium]|nr:T9SS type A sorting domain-containing protein [Cytophagales bacterium]